MVKNHLEYPLREEVHMCPPTTKSKERKIKSCYIFSRNKQRGERKTLSEMAGRSGKWTERSFQTTKKNFIEKKCHKYTRNFTTNSRGFLIYFSPYLPASPVLTDFKTTKASFQIDFWKLQFMQIISSERYSNWYLKKTFIYVNI